MRNLALNPINPKPQTLNPPGVYSLGIVLIGLPWQMLGIGATSVLPKGGRFDAEFWGLGFGVGVSWTLESLAFKRS